MSQTALPPRRGPSRWVAVLAAAVVPALQAAKQPEPVEEIRGPLMPMLGDSRAPVTIVAFSDYYCPYCRALSYSLARLLQQYPQKVRVVYRHFATSPDTKLLAQAALCAYEQEHFFEYHKLIFSTPGVTPRSIPHLAARLKLDVDALSSCVASGRYQMRVRQDIGEGMRLNIEATPTVFLNGHRMSGPVSFEALSAGVKAALGE